MLLQSLITLCAYVIVLYFVAVNLPMLIVRIASKFTKVDIDKLYSRMILFFIPVFLLLGYLLQHHLGYFLFNILK